MGALICFFISVLCVMMPFISMEIMIHGYSVVQKGKVPKKSCILDEISLNNESSPGIHCGIECNKNQDCIGMDLVKREPNVCRLLSGFSTINPSDSTTEQCIRYQKSNENPKGLDFYCSVPLMNSSPVSTICHQDSYLWTIIQRRFDGSVNFKQNWTQYQRGFGSRDSEFWIGNENIYYLTQEGYTHLRIELMDHNCVWKYAEYSNFYIDGENTEYRLHVSGYSGNAGDSFLYHNNMKFSTFDNDNDLNSWYNCALGRLGGWWYNSCHESNLNGEYGNTDNSNGINWYAWKGFEYSMTEVRMMVRQP